VKIVTIEENAYRKCDFIEKKTCDTEANECQREGRNRQCSIVKKPALGQGPGEKVVTEAA